MGTAVAGATRLIDQLDRVAVSVAGTSLELIDLVLLGMLRGEWTQLEDRARSGLALEQCCAVSKQERHAAATAFRYAHGLISAEDFLAWLRERALSVADLSAFIARRISRDSSVAPTPECAAVGDDAVADILWAEAICDRTLDRLAVLAAELLIADAVVEADQATGSRRLPVGIVELAATDTVSGTAERSAEELGTRLARLTDLQLALTRLRDDVAVPAALARVIEAHGLEWLSVRGTELDFTTEGAAREARLLLIDDGLGIEAVMALGRARSVSAPKDRQMLIADAPAELAGVLVAAAVGEVVGPWTDGNRHRLLLVNDKQPPSLEISALREAAIEERLRDVLRRHGAGRVARPTAL